MQCSQRALRNREQNPPGSACSRVIPTELGSASEAKNKHRKPADAGCEAHTYSATCAIRGQTGAAQPIRVRVRDQEPTYKNPEISHEKN